MQVNKGTDIFQNRILVMQMVNVIAMLATLVLQWIPNEEMPYRPIMLVPMLAAAVFMLIYRFSVQPDNTTAITSQGIYVIVVVVLFVLSMVWPQRTSCRRTARGETFWERLSPFAPRCDANNLEEIRDGKWVPVE